jgi:hypothetical protein
METFELVHPAAEFDHVGWDATVATLTPGQGRHRTPEA